MPSRFFTTYANLATRIRVVGLPASASALVVLTDAAGATASYPSTRDGDILNVVIPPLSGTRYKLALFALMQGSLVSVLSGVLEVQPAIPSASSEGVLVELDATDTQVLTVSVQVVLLSGDALPVDQSYDATSTHALSGVAVADALTTLDIPTISDVYDAISTEGMSGIAVNEALSTLDIPTISDTYDATSTDGMSGLAVAQAVAGGGGSGRVIVYSPPTGSDFRPTAAQLDEWQGATVVINNNSVRVDLDCISSWSIASNGYKSVKLAIVYTNNGAYVLEPSAAYKHWDGAAVYYGFQSPAMFELVVMQGNGAQGIQRAVRQVF